MIDKTRQNIDFVFQVKAFELPAKRVSAWKHSYCSCLQPTFGHIQSV